MKDSVRGFVTLIVVLVIGVAAGGCRAPGPDKDVKNPDPAGKIPAYKAAVREKDHRAARQMVKDLRSDDPAVRLFAIVGLRRLTGETFGYQHFDDEANRRLALRRWEQWLAGNDTRRQTDPQDAVANEGAADAPNPAGGP